MAADSQGRDLSAVFIPVTGDYWLAPAGTTPIAKADLADPEFVIPVAFKKIGLIVRDCGFEAAISKDGDDILFFQDGYRMGNGVASLTKKVTAAETNAFVRQVIAGEVPDSDGYVEIDAAGNDVVWVSLTEEIDRNGRRLREQNASTTLSEWARTKSANGEVTGFELTFDWGRNVAHGNKHYGQVLIPAP